MSNQIDVSYHESGKLAFTDESLKEKIKDCAKVIEIIPFVKSFIEEKNKNLCCSSSEKYSAFNLMVEYLNKLGLYLDDKETHDILMSDSCTEGEFRRVFCEDNELPKLPIVRFKKVWEILKTDYDANDLKQATSSIESEEADKVDILNKFKKTKESISSTDCQGLTTEEKKNLRKKEIEETRLKNGINSNDIIEIVKLVKDASKPVGQWSDEDLLRAYSPTCDSEILDILIKRSNNKPFIIFENELENKLNILATLMMLGQARKGRTPVNYNVGNVLKRLYKAGVFPAEVAYECPLSPSVLLLDDGYCDECGSTWNLNQYEAMQFARIVYELNEAPESGPELKLFINKCNSGSFDYLKENYPKAAMIFEERKGEDNLPRLRRRSSLDNRLVSDPFNVNRKY